jgi:outer membrane protein assembly factor BamB
MNHPSGERGRGGRSARDRPTLVACLAALVFLCVSCSLFGTDPHDDAAPALLWQVQDSGGPSWWFDQPAADDVRLVVARESALHALDVHDGRPLWRLPAIDGIPFTVARNIALADGNAYLSLRDEILAINATSGAVRWRSAPLPGLGGAFVAAASGAIFVAPNGNEIARLDASTGVLRWRAALAGAWPYERRAFGLRLAGDTLYVAGVEFLDANGAHRRGTIVAVSAIDGTVLWRYAFPDSASDGGRIPVVTDSLLADVDYYGNTLFALNRFSRSLRWRTPPVPGSVGADGSPVGVSDTLFAAVGDRRIVAVDRRTGAMRWSAKLDASVVGRIAVCPAFVVANTHALSIVDRRTHRLRTELRLYRDDRVTDDIPTSQFVVSDGRLFVISNFGVRAYGC